MLSGKPSKSYFQSEIRAQSRSIERRLREGGAWSQALVMPEGQYFCYCFYGYTLLNRLASGENEAPGLNDIEAIIAKVEEFKSAFPFDWCKDIDPAGGVICLGHANYLRAGYATLGGSKPEIIEAYHEQSGRLAEAFTKSSNGFIESFPGYWWPVDNYPAIESLRLHDRLYETDFFSSTSRARVSLESTLDEKSSLMVAQFDASGKAIDVPRGCALSMSLAFRPGLVDRFSRQQYREFSRQLMIPVLNMVGIREWLPGDTSSFKVGPVVFDIGAAASGLGIAATRANLDYVSWIRLIRGMEAIGLPCWTASGEKHYFGQSFLLGDILALWGKTICVWDEPEPYASFVQSGKPVYDSPVLLLSLAVVLAFAILALISMVFLKILAREMSEISKPGRFLMILRVVAVLLTLAYFILPQLLWLQSSL
ncbi:MAG: hypothetical protein K8F91_07220, partial [Candidatus Obscuribacterales bacterium]|nr:hypothetical protein [Candidatus Obscuribacterales bacterium]